MSTSNAEFKVFFGRKNLLVIKRIRSRSFEYFPNARPAFMCCVMCERAPHLGGSFNSVYSVNKKPPTIVGGFYG
jgi:hypothetical protein